MDTWAKRITALLAALALFTGGWFGKVVSEIPKIRRTVAAIEAITSSGVATPEQVAELKAAAEDLWAAKYLKTRVPK